MPRKPNRIKSTDNAKQLARELRRRNRLNSIKNELEAGRINEFHQIFAIMSETRLATELGISYYGFRLKINDPSQFTVGELMRFASLVGASYTIVHNFILDRIRAKSKSRVFRE